MIGSRCLSCASPIAFLRTVAGSRMPDDTEDTLFDPKRHRSHFATCPAAKKHRKGKSESGPTVPA